MIHGKVDYKDVVLERLEEAIKDAKNNTIDTVAGAYPTIEVAAAGNTFYAEPCMGDLVALGYMTKEYDGYNEGDIKWTLNEDAGFTVDNGYEVIKPGETVIWEK